MRYNKRTEKKKCNNANQWAKRQWKIDERLFKAKNKELK